MITGSETGMNAIRRRLTYANVVSTICLVLVIAGGTAIAGNLITGAGIKNNSVTTRDIKNGSLTAADLKSGTRSALTDTSPWEKIPSGQVIKGGFFESYTSDDTASEEHYHSMQLPVLPRSGFTVSAKPHASVAGGSSDVTCTGTAAAPTAPAGKLCVYVETATNIAPASVSVAESESSYGPSLGLWTYNWTDDSSNAQTQLYGSWAYRAP